MVFTSDLSKEKAKELFTASASYGHTALLALSKITTLAKSDSAVQHAEMSQLKILEEQMLAASRYLHQQYFICQKV